MTATNQIFRREFTLNNGLKMPSIGLGSWMGEPGGGERVYQMVKTALDLGYRHFDTASGYGNEQDVGRAIRDSGVPRSEIFLTTKLANIAHGKVKEAFDESLTALGCEYIDLYLMHWPQGTEGENWFGKALPPGASPTFIETWKDMENLLGTGKVKSIGISNFGVSILEQLLPEATVVPAVLQVEAHPNLPQEKLKSVCEKHNILITAYSPLGGTPPSGNTRATFLGHPSFVEIAERLGISPGQLALSWGIQRGTVVIPKSENPERLKANISLVQLGESDMSTIDAIHREPGMHRTLLGHYYNPPGFAFGWTFAQLGWPLQENGLVSE